MRVRPSYPAPLILPMIEAWLPLLILAAAAEAAGPNLALGRPCQASSVEGNLTPDKAVDGPKSQASRWGSNYGMDRNKDSAWIWVDLGSPQAIDSVAIYWEHSGARPFAVQAWRGPGDLPASGDAGWETLLRDSTLVYQAPPVDMCLSFHKLKPTTARFVRIRCYRRMFQFGFSIMELEVYGPGPAGLAQPRRPGGPAYGFVREEFRADGRRRN